MIERVPLKMAAKEQIRGNIGILLVCYLIVLVFSLGICLLMPIAGGLIVIIIYPSFYMGITMIFLNLTEGVKPKVEDLFKGFNFFGKALWLSILINVFVFLWLLLLIVPGIIKMLSYSMSYYILAENPEMSALEALNRSKEIMHGHKKDLFILFWSFFWWFLLGSVTLGIAYIYVWPYLIATVTNFYKAIKDGTDGAEEVIIKEREPAFFPYETS
ncbi:MAG: DUF975 family protein [Syntrophomonadaceae bacterium]|nr:DUF975 family protein [Syntrophomonadaceae bacterium]